MSVILLVRHGQASFGAADYDALSAAGHEQARVLGRDLAARGVVPDRIVRGELRRHRETAEGILEGLGSAGGSLPVTVDAGWDEFDFDHVLRVHTPSEESRSVMAAVGELPPERQRAVFQAFFEEATARWTGGSADHEYAESFPAFTARVVGALERAARATSGTTLVVSSGGPIGLATSHLLAGDASLWPQLNRVAVNTAVTKVISGRSGLHLSSFNTHAHLEHDKALLTYR
ncbi:histidine phosphatase family protein [Nocardioides jiangxiensis]|uniref:Histidine phosphatase family protein n=1 Tax=Nocardioides jiangxiensis TaxID=3064524 RepID=A0ABT9B0A5_9ACTN|nr:histidine phosphatase family protein [Nocardioides sp. WY-20]MDO7868103.1 histidine phosphatase family protein [Nocardioides sp. WY-20]